MKKNNFHHVHRNEHRQGKIILMTEANITVLAIVHSSLFASRDINLSIFICVDVMCACKMRFD